MKLSAYFIQQKKQSLSDHEKHCLYQKIQDRRAEQKTLKRSKIFQKSFVYPGIALFLIFVFYGASLWNTPQIEEYRAFFSKKYPTINTVSANQVGKVLEISGEYYIEKEGKTFVNSVLFEGDIITLKQEAKIVFAINDRAQAELIGPAVFTIKQLGEEKYSLNLIEGDFLKLSSEDNQDALEVETPDVSIETHKNQKLALEIIKISDKTSIKNKGAQLKVTNKGAIEQAISTLDSEKVLTMQQNDITLISDLKDFEKAIAQGNLTHTVSGELATEELTTEDLLAEQQILLAAMKEFENPSQEMSWSHQPLEGVAYTLDEKKIPTEEMLSKMTAMLNPDFLLQDMQKIYLAQTEALSDAYANLSYRLDALAKLLGQETQTEKSDPSAIKSYLDRLEKELQNYHIPPSKQQQLTIIKHWLDFFAARDEHIDREIFAQELPAQLKFYR